jgi:hypothetical protein
MVINIFYFTCNLFVKLALFHIYRKLSMETWGMRAITVLEIFSVLFWLSSVLSVCLQCVPLGALWNPNVKGGCIDVNNFYYANASIMIMIDVTMYLLPLIFTWNICIPRSRAIGMRFLFFLGFL